MLDDVKAVYRYGAYSASIGQHYGSTLLWWCDIGMGKGSTRLDVFTRSNLPSVEAALAELRRGVFEVFWTPVDRRESPAFSEVPDGSLCFANGELQAVAWKRDGEEVWTPMVYSSVGNHRERISWFSDGGGQSTLGETVDLLAKITFDLLWHEQKGAMA